MFRKWSRSRPTDEQRRGKEDLHGPHDDDSVAPLEVKRGKEGNKRRQAHYDANKEGVNRSILPQSLEDD